MKEFFIDLPKTWWGIMIIVLASILVWLLLSIFFYRPFFKRFYDVVLSGIGLVVLSPLLLLLMGIGAVKMQGNPFFTQLRPGKNGKIFKLIKFRTMTNKKDSEGNLLPDSDRLTKYGKFLRSTSLDELPELINIFMGKMSIIGPRPQLVRDLVFMNEEINTRHNVRGGLTGLAQVSGRNNLTWEERFSYDLKYLNKISFIEDMKIFFKTAIKVFLKADVATEGMDTSEDYGDYLLRTEQITLEEYSEKQVKAKQLLEDRK